MNLYAGVSLLAVMLVLAALPSASVALVVTRSATLGFANGVAVALGIVLGDLVFVSLAILGMNFLAETLGSFFVVLKICGATYLIWLGFSLFRARSNIDFRRTDSARTSLFASSTAGFVLTLGDVKAILFYASLFPAFVDMTSLTAREVTLIFLVTVLGVGGVKVFYALMAERMMTRFQNNRHSQKLARRVAGCAMVGAGTYLITKV